MVETRYYEAHGPEEQIVREFFESRVAAFRACREVAEKHGGEAVTHGHRMAGIAFSGEAPAGWKRAGSTGDGKAYHLPVKRSKAGKAIAKEIDAIRIPEACNLHSKLAPRDGGVFSEGGPHGGYIIRYITAEIVAGKTIIHVPEGMDFTPAHSTPLKQSEYWQVKETADAA